MSEESPSCQSTSTEQNHAFLDIDIKTETRSNGRSERVCGVCGEKTKSKHYGAYACFGCKAFFRRSVWNSRKYFCESNDNCIINRELHSSRKGGSKNQDDMPLTWLSTLDVMGFPFVQNPCIDRSQIDALVLLDRYLLNRVDPIITAARRNATTETIELPFLNALRQPSLVHRRTEMPLSIVRIADVSDVFDDFHRKFVLYADWLNAFSDFRALPEYVQLVLAKAGNIKFSGVISAWRTYQLDCPGVSLTTGALFPMDRQLQILPTSDIVPLLLHNVVEVMKSLNVDETEFILLKIIYLFSEESPALNESEKKLVSEKRDKYIALLTSYIKSKYPRLVGVDAVCRVGELMLLLASITHIVNISNNTVASWDSLKIVRMGELMCEAHKDPSAPSLPETFELST